MNLVISARPRRTTVRLQLDQADYSRTRRIIVGPDGLVQSDQSDYSQTKRTIVGPVVPGGLQSGHGAGPTSLSIVRLARCPHWY